MPKFDLNITAGDLSRLLNEVREATSALEEMKTRTANITSIILGTNLMHEMSNWVVVSNRLDTVDEDEYAVNV
jgi:hypothetical protein